MEEQEWFNSIHRTREYRYNVTRGSQLRQLTGDVPAVQVLDSELIYWGMFSLGVNITAGAWGYCRTWRRSLLMRPADIVPDDPVPRLLPTSASFRYCIREIYPPSPAIYSAQPTEFVFQQGTVPALCFHSSASVLTRFP